MRRSIHRLVTASITLVAIAVHWTTPQVSLAAPLQTVTCKSSGEAKRFESAHPSTVTTDTESFGPLASTFIIDDALTGGGTPTAILRENGRDARVLQIVVRNAHFTTLLEVTNTMIFTNQQVWTYTLYQDLGFGIFIRTTRGMSAEGKDPAVVSVLFAKCAFGELRP